MKTYRKVLLVILSVFLSAACKSAPPINYNSLNKAEFFQKAQEASSNGKYNIALLYYNHFLLKYPNDIQRGIEADYEIAFIAYKQHNYTKASKLFSDILQRYSTDASQILPAWPKILSQKILKEIKEKQKK